MKNLFNSVKMTRPKGSFFDLTHDVKMSAQMGKLYPILCMDAVPGDRFTLGADALVRFAPLIAPVMHRIDVTMHYFFVPKRLLWPKEGANEGWETFITEHDAGVNAPYITIQNSLSAETRKFLTYFGLPLHDGSSASANVLAFYNAAYQFIYNEYYRDENLVTEVDYKLVDGDNNANTDLFVQRLRAWEHDYFTASLPFAQKGAAVDIPLGSVELDPNWTAGTDTFPVWQDENGFSGVGPLNQAVGGTDPYVTVNSVDTPTAYNPNGSLIVGATTINDLRRAYRLQEWLEKNARGGTRYIESILAHFGVRSSDARLQRPEYICGTKSPVIISEVLNTTGENAGLPQGNMAGHGVSVNQGRIGSYYCEEWGVIMGIMSITPKSAYTGGIPKSFLKFDSMDNFFPEFAHLGEQEVQQQELQAFLGGNDTDVFGYVPRYAEYKYMPSRVAGDFITTLDYWHLGRIIEPGGAQVNLTQDFIEVKPEDCSRIFAVEGTDDNIYLHVLNKIHARRLMPKYGTPTF